MISARQAARNLIGCRRMMVMPCANSGHHAACIQQKPFHYFPLCLPRSLCNASRVASTVSEVSRPPGFTGTATSKGPFRTRRTVKGAGSISIRPSRHSISSGAPAFRLASCRIFLGITNLPAESMAVFIPYNLPHFQSCKQLLAPFKQRSEPPTNCP